jgi:uncharacterized membrane protein YeiH
MNPDITQLIIEHMAVAVSAATGVLAAKGKRVDLFGVVVLALVTALGGGTIRDLLAGDLPVFWLRDPGYLLNITVTALALFFVRRLRDLPEDVLLVADAFALALFTVVGARKGMVMNFSPPVAVLLGVITGVAGGILRDVLRREIPLVFQPQIHLYATAAAIGATAYVILYRWWSPDSLGNWIGVGIIFLLRLLGLRLKLALPMFQSDKTSNPS